MTLTILTPTYNREKMLPRLYKSLCEQSCQDFEWMIIDDGSTDNTQSIVKDWLSNTNVHVRYFFKENGGKHTALNYGIPKIESELTFIVDSDDVLTVDAVETVLYYHKKYRNEKNICGYVFLRAYPDGTVNGKEFVPNEKVASYIQARINSGDAMADKAEVFKTECLCEFPFPEYAGEKFLGEDIVWVRMARKYRMVHINAAIYIGDYQNDGLTKNRRRNNIKSPRGCMDRAREFMGPEFKLKYRLKGTLQFIIYGRFAGLSIMEIFNRSSYKKLTAVCLIPGVILQSLWKRQYCSNIG